MPLEPLETIDSACSGCPRIRILLADDHENVRMQIRARLLREPDFEIVGEAINSVQVITRVPAVRPRIVLIDPMMRDGLGLQSLEQVIVHVPQIAIVVLIAVADTALQMDLRKMGVRQIVNKGIESALLVTLLREIGSTASTEARLENYG